MKPSHSKRKSVAFTVLSTAVIPSNLFLGFLNYVIWSEGLAASDLYRRMLESPLGPDGSAAAVAFAGFAGTGIAHVLSFDPHRSRRPTRRLYFLFFSFFIFIAGYFLGAQKVGTENLPYMAAAAVSAAILPVIFFFLEKILGRFFLATGRGLYRHRKPRLALHFVRLGLRFHPADKQGETFYGLALAARKKTDRAVPYLEDAYAQGQRTPDVLQALADIYETAGQHNNASKIVQELQETRPTAENFQRMIGLLLETGEKDHALNYLYKLSLPDREQWVSTMESILLERDDRVGLRAFCADLEHDGKPYTRAVRCWSLLLEREPGSIDVMENLVRLHDISGDRASVTQMLERIVESRPDESTARRRLIETYRKEDRATEVKHHLEELVKRDATVSETLEVLEDFYAKANYERVQEIIRSDERLTSNARAAGILAIILFETGKRGEALEQAAKARALSPDTKTSADLSIIENTILTDKAANELAELERSAVSSPQNLDARFKWLERLVQIGSADKVVIDLEQLITAHPEVQPRIRQEVEKWIIGNQHSFRLMTYLADLYLRDGELDRVHELYAVMTVESLSPAQTRREGAGKILDQNPNHVPSLVDMTELDFAARKFSEALQHIDRYKEHGGESTDRILGMEFQAAVHTHNTQRAETVAHKLLERNPEEQEILSWLATTSLEKKLFAEGIDYLKRLQTQDPDNREIRRRIKTAEEDRRRARMDEIRKALETNEDAALYEELGDHAHDFGLLNDAMVAYQKSAQKEAGRNVARAKLAYVLAKKGLYPEAEDALSEAHINPEQPTAELTQLKSLFYNTGELMEQDGEELRALMIYKRVFRVDAGYRDVVEKVERLQRSETQKRKTR